METRYFKTLVAAVEEGSFSRAAEVLHITQSAVSQRIKFLEEQYGHQLLDRAGPALTLTPAGQLVLAKAREILAKEREMVDALKGLGGQKRLAICCTPTFGMAYLSLVLNDFIRAHADVADLKFIFLQPFEALRCLRNEEFDLAVIEHCPGQEFAGLDRFVLPDDEMLLIAPAGAVAVGGDGFTSLEEILRFRLFARRDGCSSKELLRQNLAARRADFSNFDGMMISDDLRYTINAVIAGEGVAFVSTALVSEHLAAGRLTSCRIAGFEVHRGRSVALLPGRHADPLIGDLLECIFLVVTPEARPRLIRAASRD
ncbi:MAG: LysR family transcriptional regulator [Deltaproteobacteria bacterium]|nr:MAG: LysR family transcriptional regulator [Deltaproteobacteria bacterium]